MVISTEWTAEERLKVIERLSEKAKNDMLVGRFADATEKIVYISFISHAPAALIQAERVFIGAVLEDMI